LAIWKRWLWSKAEQVRVGRRNVRLIRFLRRHRNNMILKNAAVYTPQHTFAVQDIAIRNGRFVEDAVPQPNEEILDAEGLYALPGLVDLHFHGAVGYDFCDGTEEAIQALADFEASKGVLAICPATMTFSEEILNRVMDAAAAHKNEHGADLVGINMEGPFISPAKVGAQNPLYLHKPDADMFRRLQQRAHGLIKLVDIAPEEEGAQEFIRDCKDEVRISLAHTCTNYETAKQAFAAGASHMTHLYNAMPAITHRAPGPIIAAWEDGAEVELITDGVHIHPAMVRFTFEIFGAERVILIADSMMACGLPDGQYSLGGQAVTVHGARATLTEQPDVIAGSATCLYDCMKRAVLEMGVPLESAVRAASENPARSLGIEADYGSIAAGRWGNVILADRELNIRHVIRKGEIIA
jgi:N-acetylglucosamine-6-phosphate deacetylase